MGRSQDHLLAIRRGPKAVLGDGGHCLSLVDRDLLVAQQDPVVSNKEALVAEKTGKGRIAIVGLMYSIHPTTDLNNHTHWE